MKINIWQEEEDRILLLSLEDTRAFIVHDPRKAPAKYIELELSIKDAKRLTYKLLGAIRDYYTNEICKWVRSKG